MESSLYCKPSAGIPVPKHSKHEHKRFMAVGIVAYMLSLLDMVFTFGFAAEYGNQIESNPLGRVLIDSPWAAIGYKVVVIGVSLAIIYRFRSNKLARIALIAILCVYAALLLYHISITGFCHYIIFIAN